MSVLRYGCRKSLRSPFSRSVRSSGNRTKRFCSSRFISERIITILPDTMPVKSSDSCFPLSVHCRDFGLTLPCLFLQNRNTNLFPFPRHPVRTCVRFVSPFADDQREGTLVHPPPKVFTLVPLLLPPGLTIQLGPPELTLRLPSSPYARLPHQ